jgi:hypothetical protein
LTESVEIENALAAVLARPGTVGKTHIEKHLACCDAEVDSSHARLWRRLFLHLAELTPLPVQAMLEGIMFFAPDGRYRMQVFALEDHDDGVIHVYLPDLPNATLAQKLSLHPTETGEYRIGDQGDLTLRIDRLDAQNANLPTAYVKNMLGWNRKALRVTLVASQVNGARVEAAEALCALAAEKWRGTKLEGRG